MKMGVWFSVSLMFLCIFFINGSLSKLERLEHPVKKSDGSLSFLVVGDWGREGEFNQSLVAHQMGIVGEKLDIDFVISVGDNFYEDGLKGETDPSFEASFSHIYTHPSLQKQWYAVLGNHDYRGNVEAQLSQVLTQKDWRWFCRRSFVLSSGMVEFFFVDTNPFVGKYFTDPGDHTYDWSNVLPRNKYISNLLHDLDLEIKKSRATWKFVVGHHGIKTAGQHGVTQELVDQLLPILEGNKVDLYINGHDHCLQHIGSDGEIQFLTSGGGSKAWRGDIQPWDPKELKLYYDGQGFISLQITHSQANFIYYDVSGNVLHQSTLSKISKRFGLY
ncbi:Purple acid phosphatase 7 [Cardamine amara subsp. amara]|uniref:Purple acid phosphatase n=1 Tax=Cardamine amara subsp. amara TaxID=228776 RepID=A0ABD1AD55_CARAN